MNEKRKSIKDAYHKFKQNPELNGDELLKCLKNYHETWTGERRKQYDATWRQNLAFYSGNHYIRENSSSSTGYRVRLRENHVNNTLNRMISIFIQNLPIVRVFPNSISNEDIDRAESTEMFGKYFWRTKKIEQKLGKLIRYAAICGNGFIFPSYDPDLGGVIELDASETDSGQAERRLYKGDLKLEVDDPFRIGVRPGIDEVDDMYDFIRSVPVNRFDLESKFGPISAESAVGMNAYTGEKREDDELIMKHHYYHKPTPWFEEGLYACWAGDKLLKVRPASESEKTLPLYHLPFDKPPMKFWGMSSIEQVMDLQEQLNRAASMIVEAKNLVARPRVFVSNEAKMSGQSITDKPGDIMRYALAGGRPEFHVPTFNFAEMSAHKNDIRSALSQVTGITGASRGEIPSATKTALALQLVLEQDRSQYLPFIKSFHQLILDMMMGVFGVAAENFSENDPRIIKVEGTTGSSRKFHGALVPNPLDAYLEDTNPLGWTAAGRAEQVMNLVDRGLIKDPNRALEMLKLNNADPAYEFININRQAQSKENELLRKGEFVPIGPEDDDATHLDELVKIVASFSFRSMPKAVQDAFLEHLNQHKARVAQSQPQAAPEAPSGGGVVGAPSAQLQAPEPGKNMEQLLGS